MEEEHVFNNYNHDPLGPGEAYCACLDGATCEAPRSGVSEGSNAASGGGAAWLGASLALFTLLSLALAVLYLIRRRRRGAFLHARLADNVEINNPMYLGGEDDLEPRADAPAGGNHFANPVYESMYSPQDAHPTEERANLLQESSPARL
ncbi:uncharacterized protein [Battus philenor]|uniref:uncharacterized protein n=1 Tax=Battus philenor TaxID=42288 RepID=UPI0035D11A5F